MLPGEVRGDAAFTSFQIKLATVVINAKAAGRLISPGFNRGFFGVGGTGCCCPLGAHPASELGYPNSVSARDNGWPELSLENIGRFFDGFAAGCLTGSPYEQLGAAYREMFP